MHGGDPVKIQVFMRWARDAITSGQEFPHKALQFGIARDRDREIDVLRGPGLTAC